MRQRPTSNFESVEAQASKIRHLHTLLDLSCLVGATSSAEFRQRIRLPFRLIPPSMCATECSSLSIIQLCSFCNSHVHIPCRSEPACSLVRGQIIGHRLQARRIAGEGQGKSFRCARRKYCRSLPRPTCTLLNLHRLAGTMDTVWSTLHKVCSSHACLLHEQLE